jgi:HlyD family secretion protein
VRVVPVAVAELGFVISAPVREVLVAEGAAVKAGQTLIALDSPQLEFAVSAAEAAYTSAERDDFIQGQGRRKWNGQKFVWVAGPPEQRQVAHAKALQAQAGLEARRAELRQAMLLAPFDGTVVTIAVRPGEVVQPGRVVAVIGDLAHLRLETTDLSERDIARVRVGDRVRITLDALASELRGTVSAIDPMAGRSADGDVIYTVTIDMDAQPAQLLWGMTGEAIIEVDS